MENNETFDFVYVKFMEMVDFSTTTTEPQNLSPTEHCLLMSKIQVKTITQLEFIHWKLNHACYESIRTGNVLKFVCCIRKVSSKKNKYGIDISVVKNGRK